MTIPHFQHKIPNLISVAGCLLLTIALLYHPTFFSQFVLDDHHFIDKAYANTYANWADFFFKPHQMHYSPLYYVINAFFFKICQNQFIPLRLVQLSFLFLNALLIYGLVALISRNRETSFLASYLFIIHPMTAQVNFHLHSIFMNFHLSTLLFSFIAFWLALNQTKAYRLWMLISLIAFSLGLLSFEGACLFPLVLFATARLIKKNTFKEAFLWVSPFLIFNICFIVFWHAITGQHLGMDDRFRMLGLNVPSFFLSQWSLMNWQLANLINPQDIVFMWNQPPTQLQDFGKLLPFMLVVLFLVIALNKGKSKIAGWSFVWLLTGFILVIPASLTHYDIGMVIEPHWLYFFSTGFFIMLASALSILKTDLKQSFLALGLTALLIAFFQSSTFAFHQQCFTTEQYYRYWTSKVQNPVVYYFWGDYKLKQKNPREAIQYFTKGLKLTKNPSHYHYRLGLIYNSLGQWQEAQQQFEKAIRIHQVETYYHGLIGSLLKQQKLAAAKAISEQAAKIFPQSPAFKNQMLNSKH